MISKLLTTSTWPRAGPDKSGRRQSPCRGRRRGAHWHFLQPMAPEHEAMESSQWPENDSSLNGDVSMGESLGSLIFIKPKPVAS